MVTGIIRLRDVVRDDQYVLRLRFDPDQLVRRGLRPEEVVNALQPKPVSVREAADAQPINGQAFTWLAAYKGFEAPSALDLASAEITVHREVVKPGQTAPTPNGSVTVRLGDLLVPKVGIEHRPELDQLGVQLGSQQYEQTCTLDGQPSVAMSIFQLPGSNALNTAKGVYARMDALKTRFPTGLDYRIVYDTTPFIRNPSTRSLPRCAMR